jgi:hypothetical protein
MNPTWHRRLTQLFLGFNSLFWLPWGFINLVWPKSWAGDVIPGMNVYDLSSVVARTEVRAMYGGLQMAIGIFALVGVFRPRYRDAVLLFFVLALSGLALCRLGGMIAEGETTYLSFSLSGISPGRYNQVGLAMYELPNMIIAWVLLLLRPRATTAPIDSDHIAALRAENEHLRSQLSTLTDDPPDRVALPGDPAEKV